MEILIKFYQLSIYIFVQRPEALERHSFCVPSEHRSKSFPCGGQEPGGFVLDDGETKTRTHSLPVRGRQGEMDRSFQYVVICIVLLT